MAVPGSPHRVAQAILPRLWIFDFDWTVVDENSDTWIHRCAPDGSLPPSVRDSYVPPDWVGYMNRVLSYLARQGTVANDLRAKLQTISWTPGMRQLLEAIADSSTSCGAATPQGDLTAAAVTRATGAVETASAATSERPGPATVSGRTTLAHAAGAAVPSASTGGFRAPQHALILSDANSLFIPWILDGGGSGSMNSCSNDASSACRPDEEATGPTAHQQSPRPLSGVFSQILTNPARVEPGSGAVVVAPHNGPGPDSAAPPHACPRCHPNLCKRTALRMFLDKQSGCGVSYEQLVYVGDGRNDLCPCLALREGDVAMPRIGFALHKLLESFQAAGKVANRQDGHGAATSGTGAASAGCSGGAKKASGEDGDGEGANVRRGDDAVYGGAKHGVQGGNEGHGAEHDCEVLRAACVPWKDAFDILCWARRQEERDGLVERAGAMAL